MFAPGVTRKVVWGDGTANGRVQPGGQDHFPGAAVASASGTASATTPEGEPVRLLHDDMSPVQGHHDFGNSGARFGGGSNCHTPPGPTSATGSRVVRLVPTKMVLIVGLPEQGAGRDRHLAVGDDALLMRRADEAQIDWEGDDGDADRAGSGGRMRSPKRRRSTMGASPIADRFDCFSRRGDSPPPCGEGSGVGVTKYVV